MMQRLSRRLALLILIFGSSWAVWADSYPLLNGDVVTGEPISFDARGVVLRQPDGSFSPRAAWTNFTEAALKKLAELPKAKPFVDEYLVDEEAAAEEKKAEEIRLQPVERLARPEGKGMGALFSSTVSIVLLLILYLANIYAGFEVSLFRNYPALLVCGVSAVFPIIGPILFLSLPTHLDTKPEEVYAATAEELAQAEAYQAEHPTEAAPDATAAAAEPAVPTLPQTIVYVRGQTTFNRRFFETKLAGFMKVVPTEAEKDMEVFIRSARGEYVGQRITRLMPNELSLQINKAGATADVTIPFTEITEVQVRHQDA